MTASERRKRIRDFISTWTGKGYEKGDSQKFWIDLLWLLGVEYPASYISFEDQVHLDHTSFIDGYIPATHVLIEQKSLGKDLRTPIRQSDGTFLTPFRQAKRYSAELPYSERPRWIVTCNFSEFLIYDMEKPEGEPESVRLCDLEKDICRLQFLVNRNDVNIQKEMELSLQAGELVGRLYDALLEQYIDPTSVESLRSLNALCVRIVFCLYAEDAGLFGSHSAFHDYIGSFSPEGLRDALVSLFKVLDTKVEERDPYLRKELMSFPYVNGGLFADERVEIPRFTEDIRQLLMKNCSAGFNWSGISPTIFGAVFESTLNPVTRRSGGMHYTSIENIHKVIDPLFIDDLKDELSAIELISQERKRNERLYAFQTKISGLKFLDPACGSGNFLTETFISLRRMENRVIKDLIGDGGDRYLGGDFSPIKVSINQFYGIEINDFAVTVAKTALWIAESQMMQETEDIVGRDLDFLPLRSYANILEGNALRMDWDKFPVHEESRTVIYAKNTNIVSIGRKEDRLEDPVVRYGDINLHTETLSMDAGASPEPEMKEVTFDYIISNPPFVGQTLQSKEQKDDIISVFTDESGRPYRMAGKIDYVAGWYFKAASLIAGTRCRAAFVSTNSITQGEQAAGIWKPLMKRFGVNIDFAYRTFRWESESDFKAHVHCVIIGFSCAPNSKPKIIYDGENWTEATVISPYLIDSETVFIESRPDPICEVPQMFFGSMPRDGGNLILSEEEKDILTKEAPEAVKWIRPYVGAEDFINGKKRWCLWLDGAEPHFLNTCKPIRKKIEAVQRFRLESKAASTRRFAASPHLFCQIAQPCSDYLLVPRVSSQRRKYAPMGYMSENDIASDSVQIIPGATLYHFGVLTSSVHMVWMRTVCGRLKSDYRYSKDIVYNNFPWPAEVGSKEEAAYGSAHLTDNLKSKIENTAQAILDARALHPDSSLADLYDELTMPLDLRRAHADNDRAVMDAYGFPHDLSEPEIVAALMKMYSRLAERKDGTDK